MSRKLQAAALSSLRSFTGLCADGKCRMILLSCEKSNAPVNTYKASELVTLECTWIAHIMRGKLVVGEKWVHIRAVTWSLVLKLSFQEFTGNFEHEITILAGKSLHVVDLTFAMTSAAQQLHHTSQTGQ